MNASGEMHIDAKSLPLNVEAVKGGDMRRVIGALLALLSALMAPLAAAEWVEARSENFIFRGDVSAKDAQMFVRDLEVFRRNIFEALVAEGTPEPIPVQIYAIRDKKQIKQIFGQSDFAGLYQTNLQGPAFILNSKKQLRRGDAARKIAFHEYTHHLISLYTQRQYPRWFNEGYAEYLSTHEVKSGMFKIGAPDNSHIYPLKQRSWFPMDVLIGSQNQYPFSMEENSRGNRELRSQFYAQSWLAVHYIMSHEDMRKGLRNYLSRLGENENSLEAFTAAFEMTPKQFGARLKAYYKDNKYKVSGYHTDFDPDSIVVDVRELSDAASDYYFAEAARNFRLNHDLVKTAAIFDALPAQGALAGNIWAGRAAIRAEQKDYTGAQEAMKKALAAVPEDLALHQIAGEILIMQYSEERKTFLLEAARDHFAKVLGANPDDPRANYQYAVSCGQVDCPEETARRAALLAQSYFRNAAFAGTNLNLAGALHDAGEYGVIKEIANFAIIWGQDAPVRMGGQMLLRRVKQYEDDLKE